MGPLGFNELIILIIVAFLLVFFVIRFIYKYGKQQGRLQELERQVPKRDSSGVRS